MKHDADVIGKCVDSEAGRLLVETLEERIGALVAERDARCAALTAERDRLAVVCERLAEAVEAQVGAHRLLCRAAGLDERAHTDGTAQARVALAALSEGGARG